MDNTETGVEKIIPEENMVLVNKDQLQALIGQNQELKGDIIALVGVFAGFAGLFTGKANAMSIIPVITKIVKNKSEMEKLAYIVPIIEKYTVTNVEESQPAE